MFYSDSMGFLAPPGQWPAADPDLKLGLVHLTSVPPFSRSGGRLLINEMLDAHRMFQKIVAGHQSDRFVTVRDRERNLSEQSFKNDPRTRVIFGLQNPGDDFADNPDSLKSLRHEGIRIMALAYSGPNRYGSGFLDPYGPLTEDGKKLIKMMAEAGMILDLSHVGHQTAWDALYCAGIRNGSVPVMASHGGCYDVAGCYNSRNLPDPILRQIVLMGGVVGVYTLTFGLHPSDNGIKPLMVHLEHAIDICGIDSVVLGTDGVYQMREIVEWQAHYQWMLEHVPNAHEMQARWPDQPLELNRPDRMDVIRDTLVAYGFSTDEIEKIMGRNFLRFLQDSL